MTKTKMQLVDWLDDLCVRFIVNLPSEELESVERICFQVEEAQWFYEDFVRPLDPNLPSLNLRQFCLKIFQHCPLFSSYDSALHAKAFSEFLAYKTRVPVRGAILLNEAMNEVVLVKGWKKGASWSFPRGKINKDEKDIDCAIREVYEETGYDIRREGLAMKEEDIQFIEVTMREQHMKLFVFPGVPTNTHFEPRTRKEISKIQWYKLSDLPTLKKMKQQQAEGPDLVLNANKFYMVAPFLNPLKKIISQQRKQQAIEGFGVTDTILQAAPEAIVTSIPQPEQLTNYTSQGDDMSRLVSQLRQSKQASRENNYPEVSGSVEAARNPSEQLKSLLNLPPGAIVKSFEDTRAAQLREEKANAMLSLLRSGGDRGTIQALNNNTIPQTPMEQTHGPPLLPPPSPKHHTPRPVEEVGRPMPRTFPFSPAHVRQIGSAITHVSRLQSPISNTSLPVVQQRSTMQSIPQTQRQPLQPGLGNSNHGAAPYQQTGDPQFVRGSRNGDVKAHGPVVPPARNLPPPNLNAHSSALLNLFKSNEPSPIQPKAVHSQEHITTKVERPELAASSSTLERVKSQYAFFGGMDLPHTQPEPLGFNHSPKSTSISEPIKRNEQQDTLLSLFKPAAGQSDLSPLLAASQAPVELSATQSPTHSRVNPDQIHNTTNFTVERRKPIAQQVTIQKRANQSPTRILPRASATVTGPLNTPQFEHKQQQRSRGQGSITKPRKAINEGSTITPQQPIKILSRPGTSNGSGIDSTKPTPTTSNSRASLVFNHKHKHKKTTSSSDATKLFRPQILKRPQEASLSVQEKVIPAILSSDKDAVARTFNQSQAQKKTLLSLFGTSGPTSLNIPPANTPPAVSPLSEKPAGGSTLPSPIGATMKSRIGSLASIADEVGAGGRPTLKVTSPVDKQFLLGFLNGVVKEGKKS